MGLIEHQRNVNSINAIREGLSTMNTTAPTMVLEVEPWFQSLILIDDLAARGLTVSQANGSLSVKPKGGLLEQEKRDLKALKDVVLRILDGEQPEWTIEHCRAVLEPIQRRRWILAPREFVLKHWPEMTEGTPWWKDFDLFPHGMRSISEPLTCLLERIQKDGSEKEEINNFLRIAVGKKWTPILEDYWDGYLSE